MDSDCRLAVGLRVHLARYQELRDAYLFQGQRADYYDYLADLIEGLQGRKTLRDVFDDDARRYDAGTVRGRLARRWSHAYQEAGGDLAETWASIIPESERQLVAIAQAAGGTALAAALHDLARAARLVRQARDVLLVTTAAGIVALAVAVGLLCTVPYFSVPRLQQVFQMLPPEYYGGLTRGLFALANGLRHWLAFWLVLLAGGALLVAWSLPNLGGPLRARLDRRLFWRLYRDFHAIRFLAMLAILVRQRGNIDTRLRQALVAQAWNARPWLAGHIDAMIARVDSGVVGAETFDTGLFDRDTWWFMSDMMASQGMATGLVVAQSRIETRMLARVRRQAQTLRWAMLLGAVGAVLGIALWHYGVIDEMRRAMTHFYASR